MNRSSQSLPSTSVQQLSALVKKIDSHYLTVAVIDLDEAFDWFEKNHRLYDAIYFLIEQTSAPGTYHWVLFFPKISYLFDSFMRSANELSENYASLKRIKFHTFVFDVSADFQKGSATSCGWWCMLIQLMCQSLQLLPHSVNFINIIIRALSKCILVDNSKFCFFVTQNGKLLSENEQELIRFYKTLGMV